MSSDLFDALNARDLRKAQRRERWYLFGSGLPALLLVLLTFVLPIGWLFWLSLFNADGQLSIENYTRLLEPIYVLTFVQTFKTGIIVTIACVLIGYPYAYFMIKGPRWLANVAMALLLVSLWTSLLVRTYAWLIILQRRGIANDHRLATAPRQTGCPGTACADSSTCLARPLRRRSASLWT